MPTLPSIDEGEDASAYVRSRSDTYIDFDHAGTFGGHSKRKYRYEGTRDLAANRVHYVPENVRLV